MTILTASTQTKTEEFDKMRKSFYQSIYHMPFSEYEIIKLADKYKYYYKYVAIRSQSGKFEVGKKIIHRSRIYYVSDSKYPHYDVGEEIDGIFATAIYTNSIFVGKDMMKKQFKYSQFGYAAILVADKGHYGNNKTEVVLQDAVAVEIIR